MRGLPTRVCVFCGSRPGLTSEYVRTAEKIGGGLAQRGIALVYGAGPSGLMQAVARSAVDRGGEVIGIVPRLLAEQEGELDEGIDVRLVSTLNERKAMMAELADAFVALPGGIGTYDEIFEAMTTSQLGFHTKPIVIVNVRGHYDPLAGLLDHAVESGFMTPRHRAIARIVDTADEALAALTADRPRPEPVLAAAS